MAIDVIGVTGSMDVTGWSALAGAIAGANGASEYVLSGGVVTSTSGTRAVSVSPVTAYQSGSLFTSTAAVTLNLAANTGTNPRIDAICVEVDWFLGTTPSTRANAGNIIVVAGTPAASPQRPNLTRTGGSLWRQPLAYVTVAPSVTTIAATAIADVRGGNVRPFTQLNITGSTWSQDASASLALGVERVGSRVEMTGQITRTGSQMVTGDSATFGGSVIIPDGYRPKRGLVVHGISGLVANDIAEQRFIFQPDGTCTMWVTRGTLATGRVIRIDTTTYLGA